MKTYATMHFACNDHCDGSFAAKVNAAAYAENDSGTPGMAEVRFTVSDDFIRVHRRSFKMTGKTWVVMEWQLSQAFEVMFVLRDVGVDIHADGDIAPWPIAIPSLPPINRSQLLADLVIRVSALEQPTAYSALVTTCVATATSRPANATAVPNLATFIRRQRSPPNHSPSDAPSRE